MPTYTIHDADKDEFFDTICTWGELELFLENNPQCKKVITAPNIVSGQGIKTDGGFKENMQRIAAAHPGSPLDDKFGGSTRTHQELKTRDAINKHKKTVERSGFSASRKKTL